jgi:hypothetical protein
MSTSTKLAPEELLPPPPQTVTGGPNAVQRADMDAAQFKSLLSIIGGGKRTKRRHVRRSVRKSKKRSRRRRIRRSSRRSRYRKSKGGNGTIPVSVPPVPYNDTSYPSVSDITTKLAATTAQSNADSKLDTVSGPVK